MVDQIVKNIYSIMLQEAQKDELTGFYRREGFDSFLENILKEANLNKSKCSIGIVDIDHFKKFNDKYGHLFGDEVLKYIASTLRLTLEEAGYIFRYGGDEFVVVFPGSSSEDAYKLMKSCNHSVANRPFSNKGKLIVITVSCGVAGFPADGKDREKLFKRADDALYFSKRYGRNATTLAGRMVYQKIGRGLLVFGAFVLVAFFVLVGMYLFNDNFKSRINGTRPGSAVTGEEDGRKRDTIILKRGSQVRGRIISEKGESVLIELYLGEGKGQLTIKKSEIEEIQYGKAR
ncbi:GGDEF domain-containing protein [Thermoproteota archaeon]